ncbi:MAG TPA: NrfD/PsrC family molybdoenzyme membrane anchor subunit [Thermomicrobiales bacterium]|nr:NrfD/PsrC family molybdoenzyme membrane anchor subunit [Thermomicrobiales bacterium]
MSGERAPERGPYGRREESRQDDRERGPGRGRSPWPYHDETYYNRPALKAGHWRWLIGGYYFVGGVAGAAQLIAAVADVAGGPEDRAVVRAGRYLALAGVAASPAFLIADLHTPARFYNMLRIVRPTSPMSLGSWTLTIFGATTGLAALGEALDQFAGLPAGRALARWAGAPAAAAGAVMATYTGVLTSATSVPLWAAAPRALPALFGASAATSACAALHLAAEATGAAPESRRRLEGLALTLGVAQLALLAGLEWVWRRRGVGGPLAGGRLGGVYRGGALGLGTLAPLAVHVAQRATGRRSRGATLVAALAALAGVYVEKTALVFAGHESARRPKDYFRFAQLDGAADGALPPGRAREGISQGEEIERGRRAGG